MKKTKLYLNEPEWRLLLHALNEFRTGLIAKGRYTDVVDAVMLKVTNAPVKLVKIS